MKLTQLTPMLQADDLESTINFYTTILDFTCDAYEPGWGWASLHKDEVVIMLALPNQHLSYHNSFLTGSIYLRTV
ncbi:MAG: VOC family protein [Bacteroidota bacterium]